MSVEKTLEARGSTHGDFKHTSKVCQALSDAMRDSPNWQMLAPWQRESLEMIQHKVARILSGDPLFIDSVRDIIGYAKLMQDIIEQTEGASDVTNVKRVLRDGEWETT